jgi:hypothetical protein
MSAARPALPFKNLYTHRTASRESTCFICGKFTSAVFTHNDIDFFYVCLNHIKDPSFCKPANLPYQPTAPSAKTSGTCQVPPGPVTQGVVIIDGPAPSKDDKGNDLVTEKNKSPQEVVQPQPQVVSQAKEYILDSKIFMLREQEYRKKQNAKQLKQVADSIPSVPRNRF